MKLFEAIEKMFSNLFKKREMEVWENPDEKLPESDTENCPHQWKYVKRAFRDDFEGVKYKCYVNYYRICENCGEAQRRSYWGEWHKLSALQTEVLKKVIIDAGNYYKFPENPEKIEEIEIDIE